MNSKCHKMASY